MLKTIFENFPIPTFVIGRDHKIIYWNRALEKLSGIKAREVVGSEITGRHSTMNTDLS